MATRQARLDRGRERAQELTRTALAGLRRARLAAAISQAELSRQLGWSQSRYSDFERGKRRVTLVDVCETAALLRLEPSLQLHVRGEALRDRGQLKLIARFRALLSVVWHVTVEAPFPSLGDLRSWDLLLRLPGRNFRIGVEAETRIRDQQELVRRIRQRERHGGVDEILIVLSDSRHNRALADGLREALGRRYSTAPSVIRAALAARAPLSGSGVLLV
ncbi:MAG: helix-turn-helix domain-containing protein [Chloroflexota bacterium]|nr:helix-turn-helix domain-containing protein [Chloroflexota bacterium]